MAGELATPFLDRESYSEALLDYARTLDEPVSFFKWWTMARELQPHYDDAPQQLWPKDGGRFQKIRIATFTERFGEDWQKRLKELSQAAAAGQRTEELGVMPGGSADADERRAPLFPFERFALAESEGLLADLLPPPAPLASATTA